MRGGVKEKSPLVAISSPFDVGLNAKYISALLAAVSRGQERSLKNFGSNSLRACRGEINREWQSAASGLGGNWGGTGKGTDRPPQAPLPQPITCLRVQRSSRSPLPSSGWVGGGFFLVGRVCVCPPFLPSRFLGADTAPWHASPFHQHPDPYFLSPR